MKLTQEELFDKFGVTVRQFERLQERVDGIEEVVMLQELLERAALMIPKLGLYPIADKTNLKPRPVVEKGLFPWSKKVTEAPAPKYAGILAIRSVRELSEQGHKFQSSHEAIVITDRAEIWSIPFGYPYNEVQRQFAPNISFEYPANHWPHCYEREAWSPTLRLDPKAFQPSELVAALGACISLAEEKWLEQEQSSLRQIAANHDAAKRKKLNP